MSVLGGRTWKKLRKNRLVRQQLKVVVVVVVVLLVVAARQQQQQQQQQQCFYILCINICTFITGTKKVMSAMLLVCLSTVSYGIVEFNVPLDTV